MEFKLYRMTVKSEFLSGLLKQNVFVKQPPTFENNDYPNHIYKLDTTLWGLKHAPSSYCDIL